MAGSVGLSQALSYARDLKSLYETSRARERELERAQERLRHAYAQSRQYAVDLRKTYRRLQHAIFQSLLGLANALEAKDPYTRGHSERVATLARRVALAAGVSPSGADTIAQAGLLHDLGKIGIPEQVLRKPGPLDAEEWAVMRRHPIVGAQIVAPLEFFADGAIIVRHHHERQRVPGRAPRRADPTGLAYRGGRRRLRRAHVGPAVSSAALAGRDGAAARGGGRTHPRRAPDHAVHPGHG
jgi:HD-GYP domain-containing protein (c-di-GMP phosphodiesterase class II)